MQNPNGPTEAAKCIRKDLRKAFPSIKFTVKTKRYSGGNSITVSWDCGPTTAKVEELIKKYQIGSFDGMTDSYDYDPNHTGPGAKYVFASRHIPQEVREQVMRGICEADRREFKSADEIWSQGGRETLGDLVHQVLSQSDLSNGFHNVIRTHIRVGQLRDFYQVR